WQNAQTVAGPSANLVSQQTPPVRVCEVVHAVEMKNFGDTLYVFDFGKNIAGVCNLIAIGPAGTRVTMKHGEFTYADGRVNMSNVDIYYNPMPEREMQTDTYYMKGGCVETYTPSFTYHGFRYVEVAFSKPVKLTRESVRAHFTHTDLERVGSFECSNELLNRIYSATCLTYLDNLVSIPTDCPQREKNGWTADANLAIDVALLNYDGFGFYEKWVGDMIDSQAPDGNLPGIVPTAGWGYEDWIGPVWASAFFMIPDALECYSGDITAIERIYPVCEAYLAYLGRRLDEDGTVTYGIGDWVYYDTPTPTDYSTTLFYYHQNVLMARFSELLGKESAPYSAKAAYLKDLVNRKYFDEENCIYANGSQAAEAMALMLGVVPEEYCAKVAANLNQSIVDNNYYLDFGSVGSKFVPRVLADYGYAETVYTMMTREEIPSWGAWLNQGLTTLAERWALDMVKFRDSSANHVFLGDISAWMTNYLAGIRYDENDRGFRHIVIKPHVVGDLEWVSATYHSVKGEIAVSWHREGDKVHLKVSIPANTTATVCCPDGDYEVGGGQHQYSYYYNNILN
ncbi:MAG: family 78 glycoside hydrolase catalytic domain, partial [Bacteroidales bacterium]|nr:family 78 glycoside hydrolase catalytic domain [Bacteroidales bacterium]